MIINMIKSWLTTVNDHFRHQQQLRAYKPDPNNLKIIRKNGFVKNFMRLCNKTMIGINRIHISRWNMFASVSGLLLGYFFSSCEEMVLSLKQNYRKDIKLAIINGILHNQQIKDTLNRNLLDNVYTNSQIQYNLHEVLAWKAIKPQQQSLFLLSKQAILDVLDKQETRDQLINICAAQLQSNISLIGNATLQFLQSDKLTSIVIEQIRNFFKSETLYTLLSKQIIGNAKEGLIRKQNRERLYNVCRDQFINW